MTFSGWYLLLGGLMLIIAFADPFVRRLPLTATILYLIVGVVLGPVGFGFIRIDAVEDSRFLEKATELAVIISLFTAGLKLSPQVWKERKQIALRLAFGSMAVTVLLVAVAGKIIFGLPLAAAILLGAVLAPTDPVLASDVQLKHPDDRDKLRFSLTAEAGLNDGTAFPFVMLGLGLLGLHQLGTLGWKWLAVDCIWAVSAGLGIGALVGTVVGQVIVYFRRRDRESLQRDEFIALGLIAFAYGAAVLAKGYGFLAVFTAGVAIRRVEWLYREQRIGDEKPAPGGDARQVQDPEEQLLRRGYMAGPVLNANEEFERILEIGLVLILGGMLTREMLVWREMVFVAALFILIRPASVILGLWGARQGAMQTTLISWFGIRGIGSLYYLMFAFQRGLEEDLARKLAGIVLTVVAASILVHGVSVTPIMSVYQRLNKKGGGGPPRPELK
jgi:sodium/hydrogen antiporter